MSRMKNASTAFEFIGIMVFILGTHLGHAQNEEADKLRTSSANSLAKDSVTGSWNAGGNFGLQINQAAYSYWQAGGVNSFSSNSLFDAYANYSDARWTWNNRLTLGYGVSFQDSLFTKTDDQILIESRIDRKLCSRWGLSALLNIRTQFTAGFEQPGQREDSVKISDFLAPAYAVTGLGFTYKPNQADFSLFISPATGKFTVVNDQRLSDAGAFGVEPGEKFRAEIGGYVNLRYKRPIMENVRMEARLDLYSNYLSNPEWVDVNSQILFFLKVNEYISANISLDLRYDRNIKFDTNEDGTANASRMQFREILGVGFAYSFGDEK